MLTKTARSCACALLLAACGESTTELDISLGAAEQPIIGGLDAASPFWNHTGALARLDEAFGDRFTFCTATLVGPETLVTAKHCVDLLIDLAGFSDGSIVWSAGPDAKEPVEEVRIVAAERAPSDEGGFIGRGQDVGVLHLEGPSSFAPARFAPFTGDLLGQRMVTLGYGAFSAAGASDETRRIGRETVSALEGRIFEAMMGDFESFAEWFFTGSTTDEDILAQIDPVDREFLAEEFDAQVLLPQYEAVTGLGPGDTQSCNGDSGGPLGLIDSSGVFSTFGVVSGGLFSARQTCDFGTVFATFGPDVVDLLERESAWEDPCGEVPTEGICVGTVRRVCDTSLTEGRRELVSQDCADDGRLCVETSLGALCGSLPGAAGASGSGEQAEAGDAEATAVVEGLIEQGSEAFLPAVARVAPWR